TLGLVDSPTTQAREAVGTLLPSFDLKPVRIDAPFFNEVMKGRGGVKEMKAKAAAAAAPAAPRSPKLDKLLERVVAEGASDLHLSAGPKPHWRGGGEKAPVDAARRRGHERGLESLTARVGPSPRTQST